MCICYIEIAINNNIMDFIFGDYMNIDEIKNILRRKAVNFQTDEFRTTNEIGESWIGTVKWKSRG